MTPLRIAQVAPPLERVPPERYGGTERVMYELIVELVARGHDVTTFASGDSDVPGRHVPTVPMALRSAESGVDYPKGPQKWSFMERFLPAYRAELAAFTEVVAGGPSPCTVRDALAAFRVAEACERSRLKGQLVDLVEIGGDPA